MKQARDSSRNMRVPLLSFRIFKKIMDVGRKQETDFRET